MSNITGLFSKNRERWHLAKIDDKSVKNLADKFKIEFLLAKILLARRIGNGSELEIEKFLSPPESLITDFSGIVPENILDKATLRIQKALQDKEKILVNGDPDADGISGTTILVSGLRHLGCNVDYDFPIRSKEGHGLQVRIIDQAKQSGIKLIITSDCGSKDIEATKYANECGIDVIITDHHILGSSLPPALAIINPHLVQEATHYKALSGASVAFKFVLACFSKINQEIPDFLMDFMLIIASFGTLSDRMTMLDPMNRIIIKKGISALLGSKREGLKALKKICMDDPNRCEAHDLSRTIIPRLNAPGRIGDKSEGIPDSSIVVDLLLIGIGRKNAQKAQEVSKLFSSAIELDRSKKRQPLDPLEFELDAVSKASNVDDVNERRKYITNKIEEEIDRLIEEQVDIEKDKIIIIQGTNWNSGVIGIDTDRLKERFLRPAMIITKYTGSDYLRGSVRSIPNINMYQVLDKIEVSFKEKYKEPLFCTEVVTQEGSRIVSAFGGHAQACGFTVNEKNLSIFISMLRHEMETIEEKSFYYAYDIIDKVSFQHLGIKLLHRLNKLGPFGQQFEYPIFYLSGCKLTKGRAFGNKYQEMRTPHVRFKVIESIRKNKNFSPLEFEAIGFGLWDKLCQFKANEDSDTTYDVIFTLEQNKSRQKQKKAKLDIRMNVLDIRKSGRNVDSFLVPDISISEDID